MVYERFIIIPRIPSYSFINLYFQTIMKLNLSTKLILLAILFLAAAFRFYGLNWDMGYKLHPDERAIIMTVDHLSFPKSVTEFISLTSPWNPHFFAYGSFPFYLLYGAGQIVSSMTGNLGFAHYELLQIPGRFLSGISDLLTLVVIFLIGRKLLNEKIGLLAAFFYTISVLPIQLSHFYAVDTLLTLFVTLILYRLILFYEKPTVKRGVSIGIFFGLALATKVSAIVLVVSIGASLIADFFLLFVKQPHKPHHWLPHLPKFAKHLIGYGFIISLTTVAVFLFFEPYALIDFKNFWLQTMQQSAMTHDAFTFPYTLQYIHKTPYFYELKNIFFYGLGPILGLFAFIGTVYFTFLTIKKTKQNKWAQETILLIFFAAYFLTVGNFAIGFMRYMLPIYPLLCLFAAIFVYNIIKKIKNRKLFLISQLSLLIFFLIWPLSFIQIYSHNNTRVTATNWISSMIPSGKMILVEHWDDRLPLQNSEAYIIEDLELYNPESIEKWNRINNQLQRAEYIIIASNRLYAPLQKLTDCSTLPAFRCYPQTAQYYKKLFAGELGFQKIAEFSNYPRVPMINITINDQPADESFTVYDHPKVMIFKKK